MQRAESVVSRYGAPVVAASFLTVGVQTAINAASGAMRMPARRYVPGLLVGAVLWALLYTTAGAAVWEAVRGHVDFLEITPDILCRERITGARREMRFVPGLLADATTQDAYFQPFRAGTAPERTFTEQTVEKKTRQVARDDAF